MTHSKAMQQIFLCTSKPMLPRLVELGWAYDEAEQNDVESCCRASVLNDREVLTIFALCDARRYDKFLWHELTALIKSFPNQERFWTATYLQPLILAQAFYALTIRRSCQN